MSSNPAPRRVVPIQGGPRQIPSGQSGAGRGATPTPAVMPAVTPTPIRAADGSSSADQRFRTLFEHAPVGVALTELDGTFIEVNTALRRLLDGSGIDPDTAGLADLTRHLPDTGDQARAWAGGLADVRAGRVAAARAELLITPPDVAPRWVQATTALVVLGTRRYLLTHVEDSTGRRLEQERLVRLALHDGLTELANRTLLADRFDAALAHSSRSGLPVGVVYIDLDDFKRVNDALGHQGGDGVLVAIAQRLAAAVRAGDTVGRLGGDEFLVIAADVADETALRELTRRVEATLTEPFEVGAALLRVGASLGAALAEPGDSLAAATRRADAAMFEVKRSRRPIASVDLQEPTVTLLPQEPSRADRPH